MSCSELPHVQAGARNVALRLHFIEREETTGDPLDLDLSSAAASPGYVFAEFTKPSGEAVRRFLTIDAPQTAGLATYLTEPGFLDELGEWQVQGFARLTGADDGFFPSDILSFEVLGNVPGVSFPAGVAPDPATLGLEAPAVTRS